MSNTSKNLVASIIKKNESELITAADLKPIVRELDDFEQSIDPDSNPGTILADTVTEYTSGAGTTINGVLIKSNTISGATSISTGALTATGRLKESQGASVAAANNLVLGADGNAFEITATTQINLISNLTWQNGSKIVLLFTSNPLVKQAQATSTTNITILLDGAADFQASAGDTLTLMLCTIGGVQAWRELGRTAL